MDNKFTVFGSPWMKRGGRGSRRLAAALVLLAVFFLPLHFHSVTPAAQVSKECSCYHGGRTQVGLAPDSGDWTPTFQPSFLVIVEPKVFVWLSIPSHTIRGPPSSHSL